MIVLFSCKAIKLIKCTKVQRLIRQRLSYIMEIRLRRIYDDPGKDEGVRIFVERLWPRGISKSRAGIDLWARDLAPSAELRKWYSHEPEKWEEFRTRYISELMANPDATKLRKLIEEKGKATFLYASREKERNSASVLRDYILGENHQEG